MRIGITDSGIGGISTLSAIIKLLPDEEFIYLADDANSPYGNKSCEFILERSFKIMDYFNSQYVDAAVIACNTATNVAIKALREVFSFDIVGIEPAIKPALKEVPSGKILVLLTPVTACQQKFMNLLDDCGEERLIISPQSSLAAIIEREINNETFLHNELKRILLPLKKDDIGAVVLGCTHYCIVKKEIEQIFGVRVFDGNGGVAARIKTIAEQKGTTAGRGIRFLRTSQMKI